jgi:hypothetical protein
MKVKYASAAPITPPVIGVSQNIIPAFFAFSLNSLDAIGEIVLVSQTTVPLFTDSKTPFF